MDMDKNFDAFDNYASGYDLNDPMIGYKYNHSYRVMKEAKNIALSLDLTEDEIYLAEVILRAKSAYLFNLDFSLNCSKIRRRVKP